MYKLKEGTQPKSLLHVAVNTDEGKYFQPTIFLHDFVCDPISSN